MNIRPISVAVMLLISTPAFAQSAAQLKQENQRLKAELQALQSQCPSSTPAGMNWQGEALQARLDSVRMGWPKAGTVEVTVTATIRNTSPSPMIVNYLSKSMTVVDDNGYRYGTKQYSPETDSVKGIPIYGQYGNRSVDTTAIISAGGTRTITFVVGRRMDSGQTPGSRLDINATFVQFEDLGQGRIRKVRDFPVAFTNATASTRGASSTIGRQASGIVDQASDAIISRLIK